MDEDVDSGEVMDLDTPDSDQTSRAISPMKAAASNHGKAVVKLIS
jgi:hypothetical protein